MGKATHDFRNANIDLSKAEADAEAAFTAWIAEIKREAHSRRSDFQGREIEDPSGEAAKHADRMMLRTLRASHHLTAAIEEVATKAIELEIARAAMAAGMMAPPPKID